MIKNIGIVLAGGSGVRFNGAQPKQYVDINGREMISYTIDAFKASMSVDAIIAVLDEQEFLNGRIAKEYDIYTVQGGKTRNLSLRNAVDKIFQEFPDCEKIIENNAACPLIRPEVIDDMLGKLDSYDIVQCTYRITDALGSYCKRNIDRDEYFLIQSPNAYNYRMMYYYFNGNSSNCHPGNIMPEWATCYNYFGFQPNFKVTYPEDLIIAETLINRRKHSN